MQIEECHDWLVKVAGKSAQDFSGEVQTLQDKKDFFDTNFDKNFEKAKTAVQKALQGLKLSGKEGINNTILTTIAEGKPVDFGTMDDEYDTQADRAGALKRIVIKGEDGKKKKIKFNTEEGRNLVLGLGEALKPIIEMSQKMADEQRSDGTGRVFTDRDIEKELWTPLVRQGIIPSNLVPDKFSETAIIFHNGVAAYRQLAEREEGTSMASDKLGAAAAIAKTAVNIGKTATKEVFRHMHIEVSTPSRMDFAKFISARNGVDISTENQEKMTEVGALIESAKEADKADGDGKLTSEEFYELKKDELNELGIKSPDEAKALMADHENYLKDVAKLEGMANALDQDGDGADILEAESDEVGKTSVAELVHEEWEQNGGNLSKSEWIDGEIETLTEDRDEIDGQIEDQIKLLEEQGLSEEEIAKDPTLLELQADRDEITQQINGYEGAALVSEYGEYLKKNAIVDATSALVTSGLEAVEKRRQRAAKRDVLVNLSEGLTDAISKMVVVTDFSELNPSDGDGPSLGLKTGDDLTLESKNLQQQHEGHFGALGAKLFARGAVQLSKAIKPPQGENKSRKEYLLDAIADMIDASGEAIAASGHIEGGQTDLDGDGRKEGGKKIFDDDGDLRDDYAALGAIFKSSAVATRNIDKMVDAAKRGDMKALVAEISLTVSAAPFGYYIGDIGDKTRPEMELSEFEKRWENGAENGQWVAPDEEVRGAGGQTDMGMNSDRATINDQRGVIEDIQDLVEGIDDLSAKHAHRKELEEKLAQARQTARSLNKDKDPDFLKWLSVDDRGKIDKDQLEKALKKLDQMLKDALETARQNAKKTDNEIIDRLSPVVDKDSLKASVTKLDALLDNADDNNPPDPKKVQREFKKIRDEMLKDSRMLASIQAEQRESDIEIELLKEKADLSRLDSVPEQDRPKEREKAIQAIGELTQKLRQAEMYLKIADQSTKGVFGIALAAAPGGGLMVKVRNLIADICKASKRTQDLRLWLSQVEKMSGNYSVYEYASQGEVDKLGAATGYDWTKVAGDVAGVVSETAKLVDQSQITTASAATVEKSIHALNNAWFMIHKRKVVHDGWHAFKKAEKDPKNRRAARQAIRSNTTLGKCVLAYGACIDGDPQARSAMQACGLTPEVLQNDDDVCQSAIDYLRARIMDSEFEIIGDHSTSANWMTCEAEPKLKNWYIIKAAARGLDPALSDKSCKTDYIESKLVKYEQAINDGEDQTKIEPLAQALHQSMLAYSPMDKENNLHVKMQIAVKEIAAKLEPNLPKA